MKLIILQLTAAALIGTSSHAYELPFPALRGSDSTEAMAALSSECTDLGEAAAQHVVKDNWCRPDGTATFGISQRFPSNCRQVAYSVCKGQIPDVADRWCPNINMRTSDLRGLQDECEDQVDKMVGSGGGETRCVDDDRPRPVRNGQRFRFNLVDSGGSQCVDSRDRRYEWGEFGSCKNFSQCAEYCVNNTPQGLVFDGSFRGYDFDCARRSCRCLYDSGTLDGRNSARFDRSNRNESGRGSISSTSRKTSYYCGKLVGAEAVEETVAEA